MNTWINRFVLCLSLLLGSLTFAGEVVNVNTADATTLAYSLDGIGEKRAQAIVEYRTTKKIAFKSLDDLKNVKGLGNKLLKKNEEYIRFK